MLFLSGFCTAMFQFSQSELFVRNLHFHVYWDCPIENMKAFGQYLHCTIDSPYKHTDLKQDTCKRGVKASLLSFPCV